MAPTTYGSVCSGIEAASVAWHPLGWRAAWLAEIEPFPSAVLAHHYPDVPNLVDMTQIAQRVISSEVAAPDVLVGGTPCQAFSVAGLRNSLADERGNLTLKYVELADAIDHVRRRAGQPEAVIVWENVPGVLSTSDNAFGCFLGALAGAGGELQPAGKRWTDAGCVYGPKRTVAWRILDAQYFGLAQRRRRVFVVASARNGFDPAEVLLERDGMRRDSAPRRDEREGTTCGTLAGTSPGGGWRVGADEAAAGQLIPQTVACLDASYGRLQGCSGQDMNHGHSHLIPFDSTQITSNKNRSNPGVDSPCHPLAATSHPPTIAFDARQDPVNSLAVFGALGSSSPQAQAVAYSTKLHNTKSNQAGKVYKEYTVGLDVHSPPPALLSATAVRRLTPRECERLQGFPDDYTLIPWKAYQAWAKRDGVMHDGKSFEAWLVEHTGRGLREPTTQECPDGPRYKALGNSMAVKCMRWIGRRINVRLQAMP